MSIIRPDLSEARRLLDAGMHLVELKHNSKAPKSLKWNTPSARAKSISDDATGYGLPLELNKMASIDPDHLDFAKVGLAALGLSLDHLMNSGVRTESTRPNSGGRAAFAEEPDLCRIVFSLKGTGLECDVGTVLELRVGEYQDVVPGIVYADKETGELYTQRYVSNRKFDDLPPMPTALHEFWLKCSTDIEFLRGSQAKFCEAIAQHLGTSVTANLAISTGRTGAKLAYAAPGHRGKYNRDNKVEDILERHNYKYDKRTKNWSHPKATGEAGIHPIPGKDGLWKSHHAGDPLSGTFDAWIAHIVLDHDGDMQSAIAAMDQSNEPPAYLDNIPPADFDPISHEEDEEAEFETLSQQLPKINPLAFHGVLGDIVASATANTEATQAGVALSVMARVAAMYGRPFYIEIGDERMGMNLYLLQCGPSAYGRKGTSEQFMNRLLPYMETSGTALAKLVDEVRTTRKLIEFKYKNTQSQLNAAQARIEQMSQTQFDADILAQAQAKLDEIKPALDAARKLVDDAKAHLEASKTPREESNRIKSLEFVLSKAEPIEAQAKELVETIEMHTRLRDDPASLQTELIEHLKNCEREYRLACVDYEALPNAVNVGLETLADQTAPISVMTGVSSGEGIIHRIRDDSVAADGTELPGVAEKRLLISLSEFGSILNLMRRPGNTLSDVIRNGYDLKPLETGGKIIPSVCAQPYINITASVTPAELTSMLFNSKDIQANADNGFANRFFVVFVCRNKLTPRPPPTEAVGKYAEIIWQNIESVYRFYQPIGAPQSTSYRFDEEGGLEWDRLYAEIAQWVGAGNSNRLYGRYESTGRRLAAILAMINGKPLIGGAEVKAVRAWLEYSKCTLDYIASTHRERVDHAKISQSCNRVLQALIKLKGRADRRVVLKATHLDVESFNAAIDRLCKMAPARIEVREEKRQIGSGAERSVAVIILKDES